MGGNYLNNAGLFLVETVFGLYILAVMLRLLLQLARADFYNPLSQFLVRITGPAVVPLRRIIPSMKRVDSASVVLLLALQILELALTSILLGQALHPAGLVVLAIARLASLVFKIFFFSILIQVILSWVRPGDYSPISALIYSLNEPVLAPARRVIPTISGLDLSPVLVMVLLQLLSMLVVAPLTDIGVALS